jgi:hypothetical protein
MGAYVDVGYRCERGVRMLVQCKHMGVWVGAGVDVKVKAKVRV